MVYLKQPINKYFILNDVMVVYLKILSCLNVGWSCEIY